MGVLILIILSLAADYACFPLQLVVEAESGAILSLPVQNGATFHLRFIHSVHRTPVMEFFRIDGADSLMLVATEYESYGVGMPSLPSEGIFEQRGTRFRLSQFNRKFDDIPLRVGPEAQLTLVHDGMEYPLYQWLPAGSLIRVKVKANRPWLRIDRLRFQPG